MDSVWKFNFAHGERYLTELSWNISTLCGLLQPVQKQNLYKNYIRSKAFTENNCPKIFRTVMTKKSSKATFWRLALSPLPGSTLWWLGRSPECLFKWTLKHSQLPENILVQLSCSCYHVWLHNLTITTINATGISSTQTHNKHHIYIYLQTQREMQVSPLGQ